MYPDYYITFMRLIIAINSQRFRSTVECILTSRSQNLQWRYCLYEGFANLNIYYWRCGPLVKFYVLVYPLTSNALITKNHRRHITWQTICGRLPRSWATVTTEAGSISKCCHWYKWIPGEYEAGGGSRDDQECLDVDIPPKWYCLMYLYLTTHRLILLCSTGT